MSTQHLLSEMGAHGDEWDIRYKAFNACHAQGRPPVRTKMVIGTDASSPAFAKVLQGSSPWGRGRVAQLCSEFAPPLGTCNSPQVFAVPPIHCRYTHPEAVVTWHAKLATLMVLHRRVDSMLL